MFNGRNRGRFLHHRNLDRKDNMSQQSRKGLSPKKKYQESDNEFSPYSNFPDDPVPTFQYFPNVGFYNGLYSGASYDRLNYDQYFAPNIGYVEAIPFENNVSRYEPFRNYYWLDTAAVTTNFSNDLYQDIEQINTQILLEYENANGNNVSSSSSFLPEISGDNPQTQGLSLAANGFQEIVPFPPDLSVPPPPLPSQVLTEESQVPSLIPDSVDEKTELKVVSIENKEDIDKGNVSDLTMLAKERVVQSAHDKIDQVEKEVTEAFGHMLNSSPNPPEESAIDAKEDIKLSAEVDRSRPVCSTLIPGSDWCVVWTGDRKVFFFNQITKSSVWGIPPELECMSIVKKLMQDPPVATKDI